MTSSQPTDAVTDFFDRYQQALLARDEKAVAQFYAVPGLVLFPGQPVPVTSTEQTEQFFAGSWDQYASVTSIERTVSVVLEGSGMVWADVTWDQNGVPGERFCYQLVAGEAGYQIAVLTPLELD